MPVSLILATGYAWASVVFAFFQPFPAGMDDHVVQLRWWIVAISLVMTVWHIAAHGGFMDVQWRKVGYCVSGTILGSFATLLFLDKAALTGGYTFLASLLAFSAYWRYPRKAERGR